MSVKGGGGGGVGREPPQEGAEAAGATSVASKLNAEYNTDVKAAFDRIMAHPTFVGITSRVGPTARDLAMKMYKQDLDDRGPIVATATSSWPP